MSAELARIQFSPDQVDLIKRTICQGATDDELTLFLAQCKRTGLDPFARQIHAVKRFDKRANREVMSIQIGIDGFRLNAERTGLYDGQEGPFWCGADGVWRDLWLGESRPVAAKVLVFRRGCSRPIVGIAHWDEYAQTYKDGNPIAMWASMPAHMLAKCAEALALRKAFPQELSGLYESAESLEEDAVRAGQTRVTQRENGPKSLPAAKPDKPNPKEVIGSLMKRKGWSWDEALRAIDRTKKTTYLTQRASFEQVSAEHMAAFTAWLAAQPDKPSELAAEEPEPEPEPETFSLTGAEGDDRADPTAAVPAANAPSATTSSASAETSAGTDPKPIPAPAAEHRTSPPKPAWEGLLPLMHELGVNWAQIRGRHADKGCKGQGIADAAKLPQMAGDTAIKDLTPAEVSRLHDELAARVQEKTQRAKQRAVNAAKKQEGVAS